MNAKGHTKGDIGAAGADSFQIIQREHKGNTRRAKRTAENMYSCSQLPRENKAGTQEIRGARSAPREIGF